MSGGEINYWDKIGTQWSADASHHLWRCHSDAVNIALIERWLAPQPVHRLLKTDLFDEACTDGLYPLLASRARQFIGIDLSAVTLNAARKRHANILTAGADVRRLPFANDTFDAIVSNSTLDHFDTRQEIIASIRELCRVLRPGGSLLVTLDNPANPFVALRSILPFSLLHRLGILPYQVGTNCGKNALCSILQAAGLEVIQADWVMHCPRVLAVPIAKILGRCGTANLRRRFLRVLMAFEQCRHWPTRSITGHFVAILAKKQSILTGKPIPIA